MSAINPFFAGKTAEASVATLFGAAPSAPAATAIAAIVEDAPTIHAVSATGNATSGRITAALIDKPASADSKQVELPPINENPRASQEVAIAEANAFMAQTVPDLFNRPLEPVKFSSGESAIAMGWEYIGELRSSVDSVNTANRAQNGKSVELVCSLWGDDAANRVQKLIVDHVRSLKLALEYRMSAIDRAFNVAGKLVETDDSGKLAMSRFTLTYDDGHFRANVGTDQHAWVVQNGTVREVSVHQVSADLVSGKLKP